MSKSSFFDAFLSSADLDSSPNNSYGRFQTKPKQNKPATSEPVYDNYGFPTGEFAVGKVDYKNLLQRAAEVGVGGINKSKTSVDFLKSEAPGRADYLASQVRSGKLSPEEAATEFESFGSTYQVPGTYATSKQLSELKKGEGPSGAQYRPFSQTAAQLLGLGQLNPQQLEGYEKAAQAMGKTGSPEAFSQFLGQALMASPDYIRKNPLAFTANLPFGGKYGVPYQVGGVSTGTFRFKPQSFA